MVRYVEVVCWLASAVSVSVGDRGLFAGVPARIQSGRYRAQRSVGPGGGAVALSRGNSATAETTPAGAAKWEASKLSLRRQHTHTHTHTPTHPHHTEAPHPPHTHTHTRTHTLSLPLPLSHSHTHTHTHTHTLS